MRRLILLSWLLLVVGCAVNPPPTIQTPEGKRAYTANEVVLRINEFQAAIIDASDRKLIPESVAREIVTWTVASLRTIGEVPNGWMAVIKKTWLQIKPRIEVLPLVSHWTFVFDMMLGVV